MLIPDKLILYAAVYIVAGFVMVYVWLKFSQRIIVNPVTVSIFVLAGSAMVIIGITAQFYAVIQEGFWREILIESYGMLFDIIIICVLTLWLNQKGRKLLQIKRYHDEIDDFRSWKSPEAAYRIRGNILRLNQNGISNID